MSRLYHKVIFLCLGAGIILGSATSGIFLPATYHEPMLVQTEINNGLTVPEIEGEGLPVPQRSNFLFSPLSWFQKKEPPLQRSPLSNLDDTDVILNEVLARKLTLKEQFSVIKIAFTRLNQDERRQLLQMMQGNITTEEAWAAYKMMRERLTEEEMILTLSLINKYRHELEELLRK